MPPSFSPSSRPPSDGGSSELGSIGAGWDLSGGGGSGGFAGGDDGDEPGCGLAPGDDGDEPGCTQPISRTVASATRHAALGEACRATLPPRRAKRPPTHG